MGDTASTVKFDGKTPLKLKSCGWDDFQLYMVAAPPGRYTLLGEPDKWISVSSQRFSDLRADQEKSSVIVHGQKDETVTVRWADASGKIVTTTCKFALEGTAEARVSEAEGGFCSFAEREIVI